MKGGFSFSGRAEPGAVKAMAAMRSPPAVAVGMDALVAGFAPTWSAICSRAARRPQPCTRSRRADLHSASIAEGAAGIIHPLQPRMFRILDIDKRQTLPAIRNVGVSACEVESLGIAQRHERTGNEFRPGRLRDINNFEPVLVGDEAITELHADGARVFQAARQFADHGWSF